MIATTINSRSIRISAVVVIITFAFGYRFGLAAETVRLVLARGEQVPRSLNDDGAWQEYIEKRLRARNKQLPAGFGNVAAVFKEEAERFVLPGGGRMNWPALLVQSLHETNFYQYGRRSRAENFNVAGLGITEDEGTTTRQDFDDLRTGVRAFMEHMSVYATGKKLKKPLAERTKLVQSHVADKVTKFLDKVHKDDPQRQVTLRDLGSLPNRGSSTFAELAKKFGGSVAGFERKYEDYRKKYGGGGAVAYSGDPLYGGKVMDHYLAITAEVKRIYEENQRIYGDLGRARPPAKASTTAQQPSTPPKRPAGIDYGDLGAARSGARAPQTTPGTSSRTADLAGASANDMRDLVRQGRITPRDYIREIARRRKAGTVAKTKTRPNETKSRPPVTRTAEVPEEEKPAVAQGGYLLYFKGKKTTLSPWLFVWKTTSRAKGEVTLVARPNIPQQNSELLKRLGVAKISGLTARKVDKVFAIRGLNLPRALDRAAKELSALGGIGQAIAAGLGMGVAPANDANVQVSFRILQAHATVEPIPDGKLAVNIMLRLTTTISSAQGKNIKSKWHTSHFIAVPLPETDGGPRKNDSSKTSRRKR